MRILTGHVSPETAYVVDDYPYGFRLRCSIRYWLEFHPKHGFRFVSQTTNPKNGLWNKPKASTYARFGGCMYLDDVGHVNWAGLTEYSSGAEAKAFADKYGDGVPAAGRKVLNNWVAAKVAYDADRIKAEQLAEMDDDYFAKCIRGRWVVWSKAADHVVEFDRAEQSK